MGRRSINTTKSGKYMNPTDQARKEARKKELKKNKKQRMMVRAAVLKNKDPEMLLVEMEKVDEMEYNPLQQSHLNDKVLKDKRRKLKETFDRVLRLYQKEDPDRWADLKRRETEYDKKRASLQSFWDSVRSAQQVQVDDIPLPLGQVQHPSIPSQIPLPPTDPVAAFAGSPSFVDVLKNLPQGILKKSSVYDLALAALKKAPGVPPGLPPDLSDDEDNLEGDDTLALLQRRPRKIKFADSDEDSREAPEDGELDDGDLAGDEIQEFIKEMELAKRRAAMDADGDDEPSRHDSRLLAPLSAPPSHVQNMPPGPPQGHPPSMPFRPPQMQSGMQVGIRLPPGPPPGLPPRLGMRLPPGPPPGLPQHLARLPGMPVLPGMPPPGSVLAQEGGSQTGTQSVLTAAPQLKSRTKDGDISGATIAGKPQIRNLSADVIRFMPTAVRIKRDDRKKEARPVGAEITISPIVQEKKLDSAKPGGATQTKDDAYMQFMKEMEGLL